LPISFFPRFFFKNDEQDRHTYYFYLVECTLFVTAAYKIDVIVIDEKVLRGPQATRFAGAP